MQIGRRMRIGNARKPREALASGVRRLLDPSPPNPERLRHSDGFLPGSDEKQALEIVRLSYAEIRWFYARIDEKLRSLISAMAFLTASGITLFVFGASNQLADLTFDGRPWNVANFFFIAFLACVVLSLSSALVALDPSTHRPHFLDGEKPNLASAIYYQALVEGPHHSWWRDGDRPLSVNVAQSWLIGSFRHDAWELARRTKHKVQRSQNAEAFMSVAVVALLALGLARLPQSTERTRATAIVICLVGFAVFPAVSVFRMRADGIPGIGPEDLPFSASNLRRTTRNLMIGGSFYLAPPVICGGLAFLGLHQNRALWPTIFYTLGWIVLGRLASYWQRGYWAAAVAVVIGITLFVVLLLNGGFFWGNTLAVDQASALRPLNGVQHEIVCVRVHGRPHRHVRVLVSALASGATTPERRSRALSLNAEGIAESALDLGDAPKYAGTIDIRQPPRGDFIHLTFAIPPSGESGTVPPFTCPAAN